MSGSILCPKCRVGVLQLVKETLKTMPENECDHCKARFHIYLEDEEKGFGTLRLVEIERIKV